MTNEMENAMTRTELLTLANEHVAKAAAKADAYTHTMTTPGLVSDNRDAIAAQAHAAVANAAAALAGITA